MGDASDGSVRIARTRLIIGVLKFPFDIQVRVEPGNEEGTILSRWADAVIIAIGTEGVKPFLT